MISSLFKGLLVQVGALVLAFLLGVMSCVLWKGCEGEPPPAPVRLVYRDRVIERRDTITVSRPEQVVVYRRVQDTVHVRIPVPSGDTLIAGVITIPNPIRITPRRVTLTYFNPDSTRYEQRSYKVPKARFGHSLSTFIETSPTGGVFEALSTGHVMGLEASLRAGRVSAYARGSAGLSGGTGAAIGIRVRISGER
jgi:hypothetical protein